MRTILIDFKSVLIICRIDYLLKIHALAMYVSDNVNNMLLIYRCNLEPREK